MSLNRLCCQYFVVVEAAVAVVVVKMMMVIAYENCSLYLVFLEIGMAFQHSMVVVVDDGNHDGDDYCMVDLVLDYHFVFHVYDEQVGHIC